MRVLVQRGQHGIHAGCATIVQQQAHAHAAVCGLQQLVEQQVPGCVIAPDVVLHIQRALGRTGQQCPGGIGSVGIRQGVDAAEFGVFLLQRGQSLAQQGGAGGFSAQRL